MSNFAQLIIHVGKMKGIVTIIMNVRALSFVETVTAHGEIMMTAVTHHHQEVCYVQVKAPVAGEFQYLLGQLADVCSWHYNCLQFEKRCEWIHLLDPVLMPGCSSRSS